MRKFLFVSIILILSCFIVTGCETAQTVQKSVVTTTKTVTSKVKTFIYDIDEDLYARVPADKREGVDEAERNLMSAGEQLKLFELKEEQASLREDISSYEKDIAEMKREIAQAELNRVKWQSIANAGLGDAGENQKHIADLGGKKVELLGDIRDLEGKINAATAKINSLEGEIKFQKERTGAD